MDRNAPDPHLRAALRHAPDAARQADPALGAQIVAAARRASLQAAPPRPAVAVGTWLRRWWTAGGLPLRLGASGALASVLLAGVIGIVWQAGAPEPVVPRHAAPAAEVPLQAQADAVRAEPATPPASARVAQVAETPGPAAMSTARPARPAPPAAEPPAQPAPPARATARARTAPAEPAAAPAAAPPANGAGPVHRAATPSADPAPAQDLTPSASPAATPAATPAPMATQAGTARPESAAKSSADVAMQSEPGEATPTAAASPVPRAARAAGLMRPQAGSPPRPQPAPAAGPPMAGHLAAAERRQAQAAAADRPAPPPWSDLLDGSAAGGPLVWTVDGRAMAPARGWLSALGPMAATWQATDPAAPKADGAREIQWWRGGQPVGRLVLGTRALRWCDASGSCQEAAWTAADAARAWQTLPR